MSLHEKTCLRRVATWLDSNRHVQSAIEAGWNLVFSDIANVGLSK